MARQQPEFDPAQLFRGMGSFGRRIRQQLGGGGNAPIFVVLGILFLAFAIWMASGVYRVGPSEQAVLRTFGKVNAATAGPGLHWYWPAPIGTRNTEAVRVTKTMELGFLTIVNGGTGRPRDIPVEALMITGDLNIVNTQLVIQYRISDPKAFLFEVDDPGEPARGIEAGRPEGRTLKDATEAALRQVVGQRSIDDILTVKKEQVQADTLVELQGILDDYNAGILVLNVSLQTVRPPDEVRAAFDDVVNARVDKESRINEALAFEQDRIPRADGQAQQAIQGAAAFKAERVARATGEAARFLSVLKEYEKSKDVTRRRLYLEAMEQILPGVTKFILATGSGGNLLQFLPLQPSSSPLTGTP